jgi:hypothetical protein
MINSNKLLTKEDKRKLNEIWSNPGRLDKSWLRSMIMMYRVDVESEDFIEKQLKYYGFIFGDDLELSRQERILISLLPPTDEDIIKYREKMYIANNLDKGDDARWVVWYSEDDGCSECKALDGSLIKKNELPNKHPNCRCKIITVDNSHEAVKLYEDFFATSDIPMKKEWMLGGKMLVTPKTLQSLYYTSKDATSAVLDIYSNTNDGTRQNALRHALWNALMTKEAGYDIAKKFGDSHEVLKQEHLNDNYKGF